MGHLGSSQPIHDHQDWGPRWGHVSGEATSSSTHPQGLGSILTAPIRGVGGVEGQLGLLHAYAVALLHERWQVTRLAYGKDTF